MKKIFIFLILYNFAYTSFSQKENGGPNVTVKWAPIGLAIGSLSFQAEYNFGKNSLTAKIGVPVATSHTFQYDKKDANFSLKATSFLAGYRTYLGKKHMQGLYLEPYFKYVHHTSEGMGNASLANTPVVMSFTNGYNGFGLGAQLGAQFMIRQRIIIDLFFLGPEINSATNNFKTVEVSSTIPWTYVQSEQAAQNIRDFVNQFPIIRNRVKIMVDQPNKSVSADFKGALPGIRMGVSFGLAF